jgi:hypothetical protein
MIQSRNVQPTASPISGLLNSLADVAIDIVEIGELNLQLAKADSKIAAGRLKSALGLMAVGGGITIACLPLIAFGVANVLIEQFGWRAWVAQVVVGFLMLSTAMGLTTFGLRRFWYGLDAFSRTSTELGKNVLWIKRMICGLKT